MRSAAAGAPWRPVGRPDLAVAVRSSATAEDLPDASFAGQQETFLNVRGLDGVLKAVHEVYASLYNDRAIAYRVHQGFDHGAVALSVGVQHMVRSDIGSSGVMFTLDTESGFPDVVFITASYGLGETIVQGAVNPDEFYVYKPALRRGHRSVIRKKLGSKAIKMIYALTERRPAGADRRTSRPDDCRAGSPSSDADVETLARYALLVEEHYDRPMDIEWAKDGAGRRDLPAAGPPGNRAEPQGPDHPALHAPAAVRECWRAVAASVIASGPARRGSSRDRKTCIASSPATCSSPT